MGNSFCENSSDLLVLDTKDVADKFIADGIHTIDNIGQKQYDAYVRERLIDQVRPISDPIKRNNIPLFKTTTRKIQIITTAGFVPNKSLFPFLYIVFGITNAKW